MKTSFQVPHHVSHMESDSSDFHGTINEIRDVIIEYMEDGGISRNSPVYTFDVSTNTAGQYPGVVGDLLNDLERYIGEGRGSDFWQFDRDDGWHDPVLSVTAYHRGSRWLLLIGVEAGYQDEEPE